MSMTPFDLNKLEQSKNIFADSNLMGTIFRPPVWFHSNEQMFLVSHVVSVWWNVRDASDQSFKTQVSLTNGVIIDIAGADRAAFASQCLNLKASFEGDDFDKKLMFKL